MLCCLVSTIVPFYSMGCSPPHTHTHTQTKCSAHCENLKYGMIYSYMICIKYIVHMHLTMHPFTVCSLDLAPMYCVLQMHEVQNLALHIRNPGTRILKLGTFYNKENLPQANRLFPWARGVVGDGLFGIP